MKRAPRLVPIDLARSEGHDHPDICEGKDYLVLWNGRYYAGRFSNRWYGLNFEGISDAGCQYDPPGTNASHWQAVWEIVKR